MILRFSKFRKISRYSLGAKFWKLLRFEFCCTLSEKLIIVPDTNYITSSIRKLMFDILSPHSFQNICLLIWAQQSSECSCQTIWYKLCKIKGAQLKVNLHHPVVHQMLIKNCKITMITWCIFTELLECKVHEECLCIPLSTLFEYLKLQYLGQEASHYHRSLQYLISIQCNIGLCDLIFNSDSFIFI